MIGSNSTGHVSWYRRFLKRQHRLLHSRPVVIGNRLTDTELNRQALSDFIDTYSAWCPSRAYVPDDIINLDETRAELGRPVAPITTALTLQTNKVLMDYIRSTGCVTLLIAVGAAGSVILALLSPKTRTLFIAFLCLLNPQTRCWPDMAFITHFQLSPSPDL